MAFGVSRERNIPRTVESRTARSGIAWWCFAMPGRSRATSQRPVVATASVDRCSTSGAISLTSWTPRGCVTEAPKRITAPPRPRRRWSSGSCICVRINALARRGSRWVSGAATTSRSPPLGCGGSCIGRLRPNQRYQCRAQHPKRYEVKHPGHRVQIDVKFIASIDEVTTKRPLPVRRHRRMHPGARATPLLQSRPAHRNRVPRYVTERNPFPIEPVQTDSGAQSLERLRLARAGPRYQPRLHQTRKPRAQPQGLRHTPHRRRGNRPTPRRRHRRRHRHVQRPTPLLGGLLQLRMTPRRPRRSNPR